MLIIVPAAMLWTLLMLPDSEKLPDHTVVAKGTVAPFSGLPFQTAEILDTFPTADIS
jgi:hypothetical protein